MSKLLREEVVPMPPVSMAKVSGMAEQWLAKLAPGMLKCFGPLDVSALVDTGLQRFGIHVASATHRELPDCEAATDPAGRPNDEIDILVRDDQFDHLFEEGPSSHRVRATVAHEIGHAVLHVPKVRRERLLYGSSAGHLKRVQRQQIPAYCDPEWQAWAFAGCLLVPVSVLRQLRDLSPKDLAERFCVSEAMMRAHMRRARSLVGRSE